MKIFFACEIFPPDIGGPATYASDVANEFARRGHTVEALSYGEKSDEKLGFPMTKISRKQNIFFRYGKYFFKLLERSRGFDVIYAQGPISSGLLAYLVNNLTQRKYVVKIVGDYAWESAQNSGLTKVGIDEFQKSKVAGKIAVLRYLQGLVARNARKVIVPSAYLKKIVRGWGVPEEKIAVIYNSFSVQFGRRAETRKRNLILSAGRLVPWKGFDALISLMPELLSLYPELELIIIGYGPEHGRLTRRIRELSLEKNVHIGCMKHDELLYSLTQAGMFVLHTGYEGLSHTLLEALAAGAPVVTTRIGGNTEIIEDGKNGILVEYNNREELRNAIVRVYNNNELEKKFFENSREVLGRFSHDAMVENTLHLFESV